MKEDIREALIAYLSRQKGLEQPEGKHKRDGRWLPSRHEQQACCKLVMKPTRDNPDVLLRHCCSLEHVANLHEVSASILRALAMEKNAEDVLH